MAKQVRVVRTVADLVNHLLAARNGGQYASIYYRNAYKVNKFPNGTSRKEMREHPELAFSLENPTKESMVKYHFSQDYERTMAKALGVESYESNGNGNIEHLVPAVMMRYISTQNVCMIAMPEDVKRLGIFVNGNPATEEQITYMEQYKQPAHKGVIPYLTIGLKNIYRMEIGGIEYRVEITDTTYTPATAPAYATATA